MAREWTEREVRDLIQMEVSTGQTMHVVNASISGGELNAAVCNIAATAFAGIDAQATQIGQSQAAITSIVAGRRSSLCRSDAYRDASVQGEHELRG